MTVHETTGERDLALSRRHRNRYGHNCPMADIDWLVAEYDQHKTVAIIDYKRSDTTYRDEHSEKVLSRLADDASASFWIVRYWEDPWEYEVEPKSRSARTLSSMIAPHYEGPPFRFTEQQYVKFLYWLRDRTAPPDIIEPLDSERTEREA